jgi:hypothetical protein
MMKYRITDMFPIYKRLVGTREEFFFYPFGSLRDENGGSGYNSGLSLRFVQVNMSFLLQ